MSGLIIFIGKDELFTEGEVQSAFEKMRGVTAIANQNIGSAKLQCDYRNGKDGTIARLLASQKLVAIDGTGDVGLELALEFQRRFSKPLRLIDSSYAFDIPLSEVSSIDEIKKRISST
jgi:hypothetical protein